MIIEHSTIKALLTVAAKGDIRFYLNAVAVDVRAGDTTLVATDGVILLAVPIAHDPDAPIGVHVIDRDVFDGLKLGELSSRLGSMMDIIIGDGHATIRANGAETKTGLVNATYPDWRSVIPRKSTGKSAQFNPELLARMQTAFRWLTNSKVESPGVHHNGEDGALVTSDCPSLGVIMPCRANLEFPPLPAWTVKA